MNTEYDCKFEEMKKYIPFLENMITRLESTSTSSSNPRQAQLDKIRSLRDLLSNKKKRMKMENLLKCEQVLVNLYAKVEQRDTLTSDKNTTDSVFSIDTPTPKEKSDLEAVRNKLKTVVKRQESMQDTLPEILTRNEVNDVQTSGTKEPALFQRRPNQPQNLAINESDDKKSPPGSASKRNYTRVLVSPESSPRRWLSSDNTTEKPLFSRRSPRNSLRRHSPTYYKKERKKSKETTNKRLQKQKDLNITLNVPEASLNSLNTKDILSRIINCSDGDVDIDTLRELRKQILGELKKTGARDDISDLILKSYDKKKKSKPKVKEVEEGELSDSESEVIESVYGSLVVKEPAQTKNSSNKDSQPRKIQICLVINSDEQTEAKVNTVPKQDINDDFAELEMYEKAEKQSNANISDKTKADVEEDAKRNVTTGGDNKVAIIEHNKNANSVSEAETIVKEIGTVTSCNETPTKEIILTETNVTTKQNVTASSKTIQCSDENASKESLQFKANFYKPLTETNNLESVKLVNQEETNLFANKESDASVNISDIESTHKQTEKSTEIPLLHERTIENKPPENTLSEIDILQALKKEILSDISVPGTETTTPPLHQPKVIKVASAQEILPKKRISIEKYKEKSGTSSKLNSDQLSHKEQMKKTSLKLTDKECERFFSVPKISFDEEDESLGEDDDEDILATDVYSDLAPKSPDHDDFNNLDCVPPVIIPVDPVKTTSVNYKADVDMRTLPISSPNKNIDIPFDKMKPGNKVDQSHNRTGFVDPRVRDLNTSIIKLSPNPHVGNSERTVRPTVYTAPSSSTPHRVMTPNARTYEMTPTHQLFEMDQVSRKHVYCPTFDNQDKEKAGAVVDPRFKEDIDRTVERRSRIDDVPDAYWNPQRENVSQSTRFSDSINSDNNNKNIIEAYSSNNTEDLYNRPDYSLGPSDAPIMSTQSFTRLETPMTPVPSFGRSDCPPINHNYARLECPPTPTHNFGRLDCPPTPTHNFGRLDCPPTPNHPFGRADCPSTLTHPFERMDCPPTPSHSFGRTDCSPPPSHSYGRTDCPPTPIHSFGRSDCPPTPSHHFGRLECPPTPNHPFGRADGLIISNQSFERSDCPPTPSHPFGRTDCQPASGHPFKRNEGPLPLMHSLLDAPNNPYLGVDCSPSQSHSYKYQELSQAPSHHFGRQTQNQYNRTDFMGQKYNKDPRLNRKAEFESRSHFDERDESFYKDRERYCGSSYSSTKMYSGSDTYRSHDREQSAGRNKYKYYAPEYRERQYNTEQSRGHSIGRSLSKDSEIEKLGNRDNRYSSDSRYSEDRGSRREYYHERSSRRSARQEDVLSSTREPRNSKNSSRERDVNRISVASNAGRSFTIDTSINATFQKIVDSAKEIQSFVNTFDSRRKRATSVGRSLARESSVGRVLSLSSQSKHSKPEEKGKDFRRASSVGRELLDGTDGRSFQEIKADFKTYKLHEKTEPSNTHNAHTSYYPGRSRKDIYDREKSEKRTQDSKNSSYSPRKNYRDPRMRKQFDKNHDKYSPDTSSRKSGIVYSNDNIITGTILSSGYGVKNYKIPKIKRIMDEKETLIENSDTIVKKGDTKTNDKNKAQYLETEKNDSESQKNKGSKDIAKEIELNEIAREENDKSNAIHGSNEQSYRRETRSSKLNAVESKIDTESVTKTKKKHRKIIYDSESDNELKREDSFSITKDDDIKIEEHVNSTKENCKQTDAMNINSSFGMEELEIFTDNTDPVIDNINALIADLDNDLNTSKNDVTNNFTKEISLENMMQNISSPEKSNKSQDDDHSAKILEAIDEIADDTGKIIVSDKKNQVEDNVITLTSQQSLNTEVPCEASKIVDKDQGYLKKSIEPISTQNETLQTVDNGNLNNITTTSQMKYNDDIDSTTEIEKPETQLENKARLIEYNMEGCSTPDSTINTDDRLHKLNDKDSLSAIHEVTSTEVIETKPNSSATETVPNFDSIGSLLAILQDKSKMKQLLTMINDNTSENEKIKKKLEKLSEIVSDDEEATEPAEKSELEHPPKEGENVFNQEIERDEKNDNVNDDQLENETKQNTETIDDDEELQMDTEIVKEDIKTQHNPVKKSKNRKKIKGRQRKTSSHLVKRVTRSNAEVKQKVKKTPRELLQLREDLKEMFLGDDVLSATGIRMCRLAKMGEANTSNTSNTKLKDTQAKDEPALSDVGPVVVLEKFKNTKVRDSDKAKKKIVSKIKIKSISDNIYDNETNNDTPTSTKYKVGPKSKTKNVKESDPYAFETDSVGDTNTEKASEDGSSNSSDSECESLASSKTYESTELDVKKKTKRKRRGWQAGVIKSKIKKKKVEPKQSIPKTVNVVTTNKLSVPDLNCFTDRNYCFRRNQSCYSCRFCAYVGDDIVLHYRYQHPHVEVPLSRMAPDVAKEAIEKCEEINFNAIIKTSSDKYVCIFCFKEFINCKSVLETLFWHIVSTHTGEFKQNCFQCVNPFECPFKLDIPPPPENYKRQLIGFMCKKCNFTQISLENLKTHVIMRHDDNQTTVYTINLSVMSKKELKSLISRSEIELTSPNTGHSSDQAESDITDKLIDSVDGDSDSEGERTRKSTRKANVNTFVTPTIQSKITFEADDNISEHSDLISDLGENTIKSERIETDNTDEICEEYSHNKDFDTGVATNSDLTEFMKSQVTNDIPVQSSENSEIQPCNDILNIAHFKINLTESGGKEYFCCINGNCQFKTTLLISMKKHVQTKHFENWDGYCYVCKVIVTPQGVHKFRDCLQHYLDKHMDNFPMIEKESIKPALTPPIDINTKSPVEEPVISKPKINVRPISELTVGTEIVSKESGGLPVIQSVMSLGESSLNRSLSPAYSTITQKEVDHKTFKYEEHQLEVVSKKYYLVVQTMMCPDNLIKAFKCSGRYCSYATDCTKDALAHATTHQRIGGTDALNCSYCDFNSASNAVDLVMHVFKIHGHCQYCCQQCFYRAASSQAVASHMSRMHGVLPVPGSVLRTTAVPSIPATKHNILTREEAVPYYICGHGNDDVKCKFRVYTPDKFCEHLEQRHADASEHPCHWCSEKSSKAAEMVQHMKVHGIMLYQCTWCVYGADNERGLLDHISIVHPDKPPQAYIRIITNKEGTEKRVLPLAFLNKHKVPTKNLDPSPTKEHPEREAKRSIEMEALIAPFVTDSNEIFGEACETDTNTIETAQISESNMETPVIDSSVKVQTPEMSVATPKDSKTSIVTKSAEVTKMTSDVSLPDTSVTPPSVVVKKEVKSFVDILVLDSDEESPISDVNQPFIDLSEDEVPAPKDSQERTVVPLKDLHKCPHCMILYKTMAGLKKHMKSIHQSMNTSEIKCPHCSHSVENLGKLMFHYWAFHTTNKTLECELCGQVFLSEMYARKHFRSVHKAPNVVITKSEKDGLTYFLVSKQQKPAEESQAKTKETIAPKRKLSGPRTDTTPFKRRYEPQEIDQLPINPILDQLVYCSRCEFSTKVRLNMVRHLQLHAEQQPVPQTVPVNPVPHLESNEKHFDKMVNLASSSAVNRTPDKPRPESTPSVTLLIPAEAASRYPKYVPERQRHTCGAKGCSYISVDEAMLRRHWDTLHSGTNDFHCVHCPPHQHLDTSKPLTATRILSHLKMHDSTLYSCSLCSYYHFKREALEKHLSEIHKEGRIMVVREESSPTEIPVVPQVSAAPTMDLKPWQCGLCKFKSMLHPEVVDHCSKIHQSKMQFKCTYCPFRTSAVENVSKHQLNSHAGKPEDIFYYFYREGSIPDEPDGTPRWVKQRQKVGPSEPQIKIEDRSSDSPVSKATPVISPISIDLNLVKKEVDAPITTDSKTMEELCKMFGSFCEPNGIKFKCPLCKVIMEDTQEGMQSHLYEELNYRKWSCGLCSYKAFHKTGLTDHMISEHGRQYDLLELPLDVNIEKWVNGVLEHQKNIISEHKNNLMKQKIVVPPKPGPSTEIVAPKEVPASTYSDEVLEQAFGPFGEPKEFKFCCARCGFRTKGVDFFRDHLETELNKIRWRCSSCPEVYQTYHETRFHCKAHYVPSRPVEAIRDQNMRAAWVSTAIQKQKNILQSNPVSDIPDNVKNQEYTSPEKNISHSDSDNSLLAVRYEENVPTGEISVLRKRLAPDSDDEKLVIDEGRRKLAKRCPYCSFKSNYDLKVHMLTHFNLKKYSCCHCEFTASAKNTISRHCLLTHPGAVLLVKKTELPSHAKKAIEIDNTNQTSTSPTVVNTALTDTLKLNETEVVLKCNKCLNIYKDVKSIREHYNIVHPFESLNYTSHNLGQNDNLNDCTYCSYRFIHLEDLKIHHLTVHRNLPCADIQSAPSTGPIRRYARKSTTKLPKTVAKKSTTKLPYNLPDTEGGFSYYGSKPQDIKEFSNVTTLMTFCNRLVPFSMKQLSEHLNINPVVKVTDIKKSSE